MRALRLCILALAGAAFAGVAVFQKTSKAPVPQTAAGALPATSSTPAQPAGFAAFHGGGGMLGVAPPIGAPPMRVRWTFSTKADEAAVPPATFPTTQPRRTGPAGVEAAPTIDGDCVYVADKAGGLRALDLASGKQKWIYHAEDGFETSPMIMNGRIYIGDLSGIFHAVSAVDGRKIWTFDAENTIHSSANGIDGNIVFGTDGAEIFCLSPDGKQLWLAKAGDRVNGAPAIAGGLVFVSGCDAQLRAIDVVSGQEKYAADIGALAPGSPAVLEDRVIIGTDQGRVVCMPRDGGKAIWEFDGVGEHAMVFGSPATADGIVVVGARDRNVYALEVASGKLLWNYATQGDVDASPTISSGRVYIAGRDRHLYVLDLKTGAPLWNFNAARPMSASPAIGAGVVVIADTAGTVRCLEPIR